MTEPTNLPLDARERAREIVDGVYDHYVSAYRGEEERRMLIDRIAAALTTTPAGWQPIETAPKDGRALLLGRFLKHPNNKLGKWRTVRGQWFTDEEIGEWEEPDAFEAGWYETCVANDEPPNCWPVTPTHWMPLPAAPNTTTTAATGAQTCVYDHLPCSDQPAAPPSISAAIAKHVADLRACVSIIKISPYRDALKRTTDEIDKACSELEQAARALQPSTPSEQKEND